MSGKHVLGTQMNDGADTTAPSPAIKVLLVEDSLPNRDMLTRRLERRGFIVCSAVDGPSGVAMAASEMPDVILMDVALGDMDGWEATRRIKADSRTTNIPIIALTAHALATDRDKSVEVGCIDFDTKPVDLARLLGKIQAAVLRSSASKPVSAASESAVA
jgi:two-component system, cell cycle response regulator DivK